ncbi:MAG: hypothetical protein WC608_02270 [Parcubacteria group bacterium]
MANKLAIIIIAGIIIITVVALGAIWDRKATVDDTAVVPVVKQSVPKNNNTAANEEASNSTDSGTKAIEDDLNSVNDDSFSEDKLSDSEMGL